MLLLPSPVVTLQFSPAALFSHSSPKQDIPPDPLISTLSAVLTSQPTKGEGQKIWATWDMKIFTSLSWHKVLATGSSDKLSGSPFLTHSAPGRRLSLWPCSDTSACKEKAHTLVSPNQWTNTHQTAGKTDQGSGGGVVSSASHSQANLQSSLLTPPSPSNSCRKIPSSCQPEPQIQSCLLLGCQRPEFYSA